MPRLLVLCQLSLALIIFIVNLLVPVDGFTARKATARYVATLPAFYHGNPHEYHHDHQFNGLLDTPAPSTTSQGDDSIVITSHADWLELIHGHNDDDNDHDENTTNDRLSLVLFKAAFCKSCQRLERQWKQRVIPLVGPSLQVATVEFTTNKSLVKKLMVKDLPTIHFYRHGNLLTEFTCPPKNFSKIMDTVHYYLHHDEARSPHYQIHHHQQQQLKN